MKLSLFTGLALCAFSLFAASQAMAFSEDDKSMNASDGTPKFSDPDDKTPGTAVYMQSGKADNGAVDPSSIRYDYDPESGSSVPHRQ